MLKLLLDHWSNEREVEWYNMAEETERGYKNNERSKPRIRKPVLPFITTIVVQQLIIHYVTHGDNQEGRLGLSSTYLYSNQAISSALFAFLEPYSTISISNLE